MRQSAGLSLSVSSEELTDSVEQELGSQALDSQGVLKHATWLPKALQGSAVLHFALLFLGLFLVIHGQEVASPTFNVDDWALITDPIQQAHQSRPAWDLLYGWLFQSSYSTSIGWLLAAATFYGLAVVVAFFFSWITPAWFCLLALLVSLHAYTLDLFNFSFAIGAYLLPAALSVCGALLMGYGPRPLLAAAWIDWLLGAALVMVAMGIYQPTGYVGIGLIGLDLLARALDGRTFRRLAWLRVGLGMLAGSLAYYGWSLIAMAGTPPNERTGFANLQQLIEKIGAIKVYREIYNTKVALLSTAPQFLFSITFLLLLLIVSVLLLRQPLGPALRRRRLGQLWLAAAFLTLLPLLLFFVLRAGFPSRAFCLGNLGIAWFSGVVLAWLQRPDSLAIRAWSSSGARLVSRLLVALLVVAYLVPQAGFASKMWDRIQLLERRDMAMAQAILADVHGAARQRGTAAEPFRLFGTTERNESFPHWSSVGESAFRQPWSIQGIFRNLLGVEVETITYRQPEEATVRASLPICRAYPDPASIVWHQGRWLVCLEANPVTPTAPARLD